MSLDYSKGTPNLAAFLNVYEQDDNEWWRTESGHHQNLFDAAVDELAALQARNVKLEAFREAFDAWNRARNDPYLSERQHKDSDMSLLAARSLLDEGGTK